MVRNAVTEMRRYYTRKIVDVLIKVTKTSLDSIRKRFVRETDSGKTFFHRQIMFIHIISLHLYKLSKFERLSVVCLHTRVVR